MHINPDHFLETDKGRVFTHERNNEAWKKSYQLFHQALQVGKPNTEIYVLIGAQGSGKSTWAKKLARVQPEAIIFDALLIKYRERMPILAAAEARGINTIAVWFKAPLAVCLKRNAARSVDEAVPEQAVRNVFAALEPPTLAEGFAKIVEVDALLVDF